MLVESGLDPERNPIRLRGCREAERQRGRFDGCRAAVTVARQLPLTDDVDEGLGAGVAVLIVGHARVFARLLAAQPVVEEEARAVACRQTIVRSESPTARTSIERAWNCLLVPAPHSPH